MGSVLSLLLKEDLVVVGDLEGHRTLDNERNRELRLGGNGTALMGSLSVADR